MRSPLSVFYLKSALPSLAALLVCASALTPHAAAQLKSTSKDSHAKSIATKPDFDHKVESREWLFGTASYFTEPFAGGFALEMLSVYFIPQGGPDFYVGCGEKMLNLPTDPTGGNILPLTDDDSATTFACRASRAPSTI